jgi:hypothetical protein
MAVMLCFPTDNEEIENAAACADPLTATVPKTLEPSSNSTFPVGDPFFAVTVAVNVTDWPGVAEESEETSATEVAATDIMRRPSSVSIWLENGLPDDRRPFLFIKVNLADLYLYQICFAAYSLFAG